MSTGFRPGDRIQITDPSHPHDTTPALDLAFAMVQRAHEIRSQQSSTKPQPGDKSNG